MTLLLLGEKTPKFNLGWVALILALYFFYLGYHYYILRLKTPSFPEMIKIIKAEEVKRGLYLDDSPINVYGEPLGADLFGIRFLDICTTYIIFRNIYIGRSFKDIPELQSENEKLTIMKTLAERGVTNAVEI